MKDNKSLLSKVSNRLFSTSAAGVYMLLFAAAIGIATFIENDFGTPAAQKLVYQTLWFELLLILFGICIIVNVFRFKLIEQKKWSILVFHLSIVIILIGAGITRYFGYEGMMHIRENDMSDSFLSSDMYLNFNAIQGDKKYSFEESVLFAGVGNNKFDQTYIIGDQKIKVALNNFVPNPEQIFQTEEGGFPMIKLVIAGNAGREEYFLKKGEDITVNNQKYTFGDMMDSLSVNFYYRNDSLLVSAPRNFGFMVMATQERDSIFSHETYPLRTRALYSDGNNNFVVADFNPSATLRVESTSKKLKNESKAAVQLLVSSGNEVKKVDITGQKGMRGQPEYVQIGNTNLAISYGSKVYKVPFFIKLYDFIMDRYPGTNSAASYASEVQLIDEANGVTKDFRIFMNNILDYDGYRFFQSSYDPDEKGTYLSVNHDFWGTWVSYFGYILLTIGMFMALFSKKGRILELKNKLKKLQNQRTAILLVLFMGLSQFGFAQDGITDFVSTDHAQKFGSIITQDFKGRMKPINTLSREVMRKLYKSENIYGLNSDQVMLGMLIDPNQWSQVPLIKLSEPSIVNDILNTESNALSYNQFFSPNGEYLLKEPLKQAYNMDSRDRGINEKELIKIDEKVNIAGMIFSGRLLKIFPVPDHENNLWLSPIEAMQAHPEGEDFAADFFTFYIPDLLSGITEGNYSKADADLQSLKDYQNKYGSQVMPSNTKIKSELLLNKLNLFNRLSAYYGILGLLFLISLFTKIFSPRTNTDVADKLLIWFAILGFVLHTFGLALRWYVSGRAPWSNGYESMIYIGWTSVLAGLIFSRKSTGGMAATMILAATILFVSMLSFLDPEITPLVPVLKSYWLTIHVSMIAGSYGFLMLGAIIGLINLFLLLFANDQNKYRIENIVKELSYLSEMTLIGGLFMLSIGTYLGGVWANESWGRYWGWDAKETWALVTVLVYAFILHMRLIPKINGLFAFNVASLFGWASVIMTYFGVNYYLSGLHSYAAGDPLPIPTWVYFAVTGCFVLGIASYFRNKKYKVIS
ncbi:MAG TPA: cytochrome c biogenesis protein CcsA [Saprospiraceae bacterium]|nr:cytochrome c biogenesis protein CcsA [Saprospiraceae bacterium]HRX28431.1 cytochrome c biogenesis protein CcsA [Saprospiraceae bacterium]